MPKTRAINNIQNLNKKTPVMYLAGVFFVTFK
jgi:hypothetical protein